MASEGFTKFNHLSLDMISLHDANTSVLSCLCLATILLHYTTKSDVCWSCTKRRKKLISCKSLD